MTCVRLIGLQGFFKPRLRIFYGLITGRRNMCKDVEKEVVETASSAGSSEKEKNQFVIHYENYAGLAAGCAVVQLGGTAVMATVVGKGQPCNLDIPLAVTFTQKAAAIGRIPTNFFRKDLGHSDYEILLSRVIDRSIRPMFEPGKAIETHIYCNPLAMDGQNFPDVVAINAASAALYCSDIPWLGPVAATRVALIDNEVVLNPTKREVNNSLLSLIVTFTKKSKIVMIEGPIKNLSAEELKVCFKAAKKNCNQTLMDIENGARSFKKEKRDLQTFTVPEEISRIIEAECETELRKILTCSNYCKITRDQAITEVKKKCEIAVNENFPDTSPTVLESAFFLYLKELYTKIVMNDDVRCDGRKVNDIRQISGAVQLYDSLHGSSMFRRGQTNVFCTVALDSPNSVLRMDLISRIVSGVKEKNFFLDYQFPPFATGDLGMKKVLNRRERGHANLAENALKASIPDSVPFAVRLTSEVLESNGSSSMATVCGGTMALYDAGINLHYPVAGVAMGLLVEKDTPIGEECILTDIMGMEDYLGCMDFKIAGTKTGFTAMQLDMKIPGVNLNVILTTLAKAKVALKEILHSMDKIISKPCVKPKSQMPVMQEIEIPVESRYKMLYQNRAWIKKMEIDVGVDITQIENGKLVVFAPNQSAMDEIIAKIKEMEVATKGGKLEFGEVYKATVVEVLAKGCTVKMKEHSDPVFIPLSQLDARKVFHPHALKIQVGSELMVKFFGRDPVTGNIRLSRRVLLETPVS